MKRTTLSLLFALLALALAPAASAVPPGGAGPNTPGTSSSISTPSVEVGGRVSFTVSGYPAGETLYIKIDDEGFCTAPPFGACVYHQQKIGANGTVSGSFALPAGLAPGQHTLRFLATEETDKGLLGYTRRSPAFTVVAAGSSSASGSDKGASSSSASTSGGTADASATDTATTAAEGGTGTAQGLAAGPRGDTGAAADVAGGPAAEPASGEAVLTAVPTAAEPAEEDLLSMPWVGLYVLVGCLVLSSVISTVTIVRRR